MRSSYGNKRATRRPGGSAWLFQANTQVKDCSLVGGAIEMEQTGCSVRQQVLWRPKEQQKPMKPCGWRLGRWPPCSRTWKPCELSCALLCAYPSTFSLWYDFSTCLTHALRSETESMTIHRHRVLAPVLQLCIAACS